MSPMESAASDGGVKVVVKDPYELLAEITQRMRAMGRPFELLLHFVPGAKEFLIHLGEFIQMIPCASLERPLFDKAMYSGMAAVERLGLSPITVSAHRDGFPIFVREVLSCTEELLQVRVTDAKGVAWDPMSGPLSSFASSGESVSACMSECTSGRHERSILRLVLVAHCANLQQIAALSGCWVFVLEA